jgi:hypothetical protein
MSGVSSGVYKSIILCDKSISFSSTSIQTTQIIPISPGQSIYICGFIINSGGTNTVKIQGSTSIACTTGVTSLTPSFSLISGSNIIFGQSLGSLFNTPNGNNVCIVTTTTGIVNLLVIYTVF